MTTLFCGVDFHKRTCTIATVDSTGKAVERTKVVQTERLVSELRNMKGDVVVGLESSGGVNHMADEIKTLGHQVRIINSNKSRAIGYGGKKTDKRDAEMIAKLLKADFVPEVAHRSKAARDMSLLITAREKLVTTRTSQICHVRGLLREYGIVMNAGVDTFYREAAGSIDQLKRVNLELAEVLEFTLSQINQLRNKAIEIEQKIEAKTLECEKAKRLREIPGIGLLTTFLMISVVDDIGRFPDAKSFASYLGLVPRENSSGDHRRLGSVTKSGNETLRRYLIHGARALLNSRNHGQDPVYQWAKRLEDKKGTNKATVALAHKLARIAFAVMRDSRSYINRGTATNEKKAA